MINDKSCRLMRFGNKQIGWHGGGKLTVTEDNLYIDHILEHKTIPLFTVNSVVIKDRFTEIKIDVFFYEEGKKNERVLYVIKSKRNRNILLPLYQKTNS